MTHAIALSYHIVFVGAAELLRTLDGLRRHFTFDLSLP